MKKKKGILNASNPAPLIHKKIVLTRPRQQSLDLLRQLHFLGATTFSIPTIEIQPLLYDEVTGDTLQKALQSDAWIFSSQNGVELFFRLLRKHFVATKSQGEFLQQRYYATVGSVSANLLQRQLDMHAIKAEILAPQLHNTQQVGTNGLLQLIRQNWHPENCRRISMVTALDEGGEMNRQLQKLGFETQLLPCYQTISLLPSAVDLHPFQNGSMDYLLFYSPSALRSFTMALKRANLFPFQAIKGRFPIAICIGSTTLQAAREHGYFNAVEAIQANLEGVLETLLSLAVAPEQIK
jgi:uroporphyrinogen-III synthase